MEPMTLGSPVGSPSSPPTSPFLPAFLMGEQAATPGSIAMAKSPPLTGKQISFGMTPTLASPKADARTNRPSASVLHAAEKGSGPPTRGLYDADDAYQPMQSPLAAPDHRFETPNTPSSYTPAPTFSAAPTNADGHWVTVFGFPSSAASHILSQFAQYGTVLTSRSSPRGNWLHIKYQSSIEARKALSNNGKVFAGTFMVAVMPCKDPDVLMESSDKENQSMATTGTDGFFSPSASYQRAAAYRGADLNTPNRPESAMLSPLTPRQNTARPLAQAYRAAQHPTEVVCSQSVPQRSTSLVGKAMEYIFGW